MGDFQWTPANDFEEELVASQPQHDFIFGTSLAEDTNMFKSRPDRHLELAAKRREKNQLIRENCAKLPYGSAQREKLETIAIVQKIAHTKGLDQLPAVSDWDNNCDQERETIAMMRYCGIGPSLDEPLTLESTKASKSNSAKYIIVKDKAGNLPVFFDSEYFKLELRNRDATNNETESTISSKDELSCSSTDSENASFSSSHNILKAAAEPNQFEYVLLNNTSDSSDFSTTSSGSSSISTTQQL